MNNYLVNFISLLFQWQFNGGCQNGNECTQARDSFTHFDDPYSIHQRYLPGYMQWKIEPPYINGSIFLAFKDFSTNEAGSVQLTFHKSNGSTEQRTYRGNLSNFEMVVNDTRKIIVNTTIGLGKTHFTLKYYADCHIIQSSPFEHDRVIEAHRKCVIINPANLHSSYNRIYLNLRRLWLPAGMRLKIEKLHTSETLDILRQTEHRHYSFQSNRTENRNSYAVLFDFECLGTCEYEKKEYLISHYVMRVEDIQCIEEAERCIENPKIANRLCYQRCRPLEDMRAMEQFNMISYKPTIFSNYPHQVLNVCPLKTRYCQCDITDRQWQYYCKNHTICLKMVKCRWNCIIHKSTTCKRLRRGYITLI